MKRTPESSVSDPERNSTPRKWPLWFESDRSKSMRTHGGLRTELWSQRMSSELREKLKDPLYLPSKAEVMKIEDFTEYSHELGEHEILNKEYIQALARHIRFVARRIPRKEGEPFRVVEVGAGSGRLTYFLSKEFKRTDYGDMPSVEAIATTRAPKERASKDDVPDMPVLAPVEFLLANEAIEKYHPSLVIAAWPTLDDLDRLVANEPSVKELILIGLDEACHIRKDESGWPAIPGFSQRDLTDAERVQTSRMDRRQSARTESSTHLYQRIDAFPVKAKIERATLPNIPLPDFSPFGRDEHYRTVTHTFPFPERDDLTGIMEYDQFGDKTDDLVKVRLSAVDTYGTQALVFHAVIRRGDPHSTHRLVPEAGSDKRAYVFTTDVESEYRGQGLGHAGMQMMEQILRRIGIAQPSAQARWIELQTNVGSTAELVSELGFEPFPGCAGQADRVRTNGATSFENVPKEQQEVPFYKAIDPTVTFKSDSAPL